MDDLVTRLRQLEQRITAGANEACGQAADRITALEAALKLAANRLHRCSVDYETGTRQFIEVGEWAEEARAALRQHLKDADNG